MIRPILFELPPLPAEVAVPPPRLPRVIDVGAGARRRVPDPEVEDLPERSLD